MTRHTMEEKLVPVEWHYPEELLSRYATNMIVQHSDHEFVIQFFEVLPPLVLGTPEEQKVQLGGIKSVRAECVARVIVAPERMPEFVRVLQDNLEKYHSKREEE